jgi:hypothetical protein
MPEAKVHLVITTHTPRHLASMLASLAWQTEPPASVVVTCDGDDPAIDAAIDTWVPPAAAKLKEPGRPDFVHVSRAHGGVARPNQARNNGVRALDGLGLLRAHDVLVFLDGDMLLAPGAVAGYRRETDAGADLLIPFRVNLDQARTEVLTPDGILRDGPIAEVGAADAALAKRHARYRRQLWLSKFLPILTKPHKPKIITAHVGVRVSAFEGVNGLDEEYSGYGFEDDDLARRLHALRPRPRTRIVVRDILAAHLWHPSRAPASPMDAPGYERFMRAWSVRAERGLVNPIKQDEPRIRLVAGRGTSER